MTIFNVAIAWATCTKAYAESRLEVPDGDAVLHDDIYEPWWKYFQQSFYHATIIPLLALTIAFAWMATPIVKEYIPPGFHRFQASYLLVWNICVAADWLQGPYVYALYSAYGFSSSEIAELFVVGFVSSLIFGCIVGSLADRCGRKRSCMAYCVFYILSCATKHCANYKVLAFGRITGGIATSMLFSCFECWMVAEHVQRHQFSNSLLSYMFGLMFMSMYAIAIASGLVAQSVVDALPFKPLAKGSSFYVGGFTAPFDVAMICMGTGLTLIAILWDENYGSDDKSTLLEDGKSDGTILQHLCKAWDLLRKDRSMVLLCVLVSSFEGAMFAFVFYWTPALQSKATPSPHGVIFSLFMMACMCGASWSTISSGCTKPAVQLTIVFSLGIIAFLIAAFCDGSDAWVKVCFVAFLIFEFCCGAYFPSVGVVKSSIVPEHVRGAVYNIYRVPLNILVVSLMLSHFTMIKCFTLCATLLTVGLCSVIWISMERRLFVREPLKSPSASPRALASSASAPSLREGGPGVSKFVKQAS
mmetsp:Transcript_58241/g.103454  ORF Transcript_58241/g.103454 Transcript_58241/m.103454 type:complete len:529 (+) Transcript_58241:223-1809(+)